jgi:hypothetical protein
MYKDTAFDPSNIHIRHIINNNILGFETFFWIEAERQFFMQMKDEARLCCTVAPRG